MISEIQMPKSILDEIKQSAIEEAENHMEVRGCILGTYAKGVASGLKRYDFGLAPQRAPRYPFFLQLWSELCDDAEEIAVKDKKTPSLVVYHSHPLSYLSKWSTKDLKNIEKRPKGIFGEHVKEVAYMLYTVKSDEFIAINNKCKNIPVTNF